VNRRTLLAAGVTGLLVLPLLGASCVTTQPPAGTGQPIIQFEGDSITVLATSDIDAHYASDHDVGINALWGWDTWLDGPTSQPILAQVAESPAVEVVNLGTNDIARIGAGWPARGEPSGTLADAESRLRGIVDAFGPTTCVVVTTIDSHDENATWDPTGSAAAFDDWIRATFAHVADWDAAFDPSYFDTAGQPHPNELGIQALIATYDRAIATCP